MFKRKNVTNHIYNVTNHISHCLALERRRDYKSTGPCNIFSYDTKTNAGPLNANADPDTLLSIQNEKENHPLNIKFGFKLHPLYPLG